MSSFCIGIYVGAKCMGSTSKTKPIFNYIGFKLMLSGFLIFQLLVISQAPSKIETNWAGSLSTNTRVGLAVK